MNTLNDRNRHPRRLILLGGFLSTLVLSNCGYTARDFKKAQDHAYQRGVAAGRAAIVRQDYHAEQKARESTYNLGEDGNPLLPPLPVKRRYYEIPIPAYTAEDGVRIEAHTQNIEVIQP